VSCRERMQSACTSGAFSGQPVLCVAIEKALGAYARPGHRGATDPDQSQPNLRRNCGSGADRGVRWIVVRTLRRRPSGAAPVQLSILMQIGPVAGHQSIRGREYAPSRFTRGGKMGQGVTCGQGTVLQDGVCVGRSGDCCCSTRPA
jgi:hypothetical protein